MTEFKTDIYENGKKFELVFQTDNKAYFEKMQATARDCIDNKPVTQFDRIKAMSVEEMAEKIPSTIICDYCPSTEYCNRLYELGIFKSCKESFKQWLESEVSE